MMESKGGDHRSMHKEHLGIRDRRTVRDISQTDMRLGTHLHMTEERMPCERAPWV